MGDVVDMRSRARLEPVPDPEPEPVDWQRSFTENHLPEFMWAAKQLDEAPDEGTTRQAMERIRGLVEQWPK